MIRNRFVCLSVLLLLAASLFLLGGCDYITGEAPDKSYLTTVPSSSTRWVWSLVNDTYPSTVVDRSTMQPLRDATPHEAFGIIGTSSYLGNPVVLDVRTPQEYASGYIHGAINIDLNSSTFKDEISKLDKKFAYIVYCRTGVRSSAARDIMEDLGFPYVINMTGGITEWITQGLPVVK